MRRPGSGSMHILLYFLYFLYFLYVLYVLDLLYPRPVFSRHSLYHVLKSRDPTVRIIR